MKIFDNWLAKATLGGALILSCGMAQAQGSVTLYGVVDGGLLYTRPSRTRGHSFR
jgi:predicted porin